MVSSLIEKGFKYQKDAVGLAMEDTKHHLTTDQCESNKAYLALLTYCDGVLRQNDEGKCGYGL